MNKTFFCLLFFFAFITGYSSNQVDSLFTELDKEIDNRKVYDSKKEARIFNLKKLISEKDIALKNKYFLTKNLINEYQYYSFDSTLYYIEENIKLGNTLNNPYFSQESTLKLAEILAMSGRFKEAIDILNEIDKQSLPKELFKDYYLSYKKCFSELLATSKVNRIKIKYDDLYNAYKDSLDIEVSNLKLSSISLLAIEEQNYRDLGKFKEALDINDKRMSLVEMGTRDYSLVTFERSYTSFDFYKNRVDQKKHLILSAISDIKASVKDNASLANLAIILFEEGNVDKAHRLISLSFEDAKFYNSKLRFLNISNTLPVISKSFDERNLEQRNKLKKQIIFISLLSLVLIVALFYIFKLYKNINISKEELKKANLELKSLNNKLKFTNTDLQRLYNEISKTDVIKEHYIGTFLNLYSEYIDKLDIYRKTVRKYIITNKTKDLLELTKSKKVIDDELNIFYTNFDKSFLHIYPNFIESLNSLLQDEFKIVTKKGEILNTELRIFALVRLGITNSSKISKILRYSVNTIYNYRVKVRNSAINRDDFEDMVKKIL